MLTRLIDPDLLRTFVLIAETGSFTRAAELVGRGQSTVSMQVQRLEGVLERTLIIRAKGGAIRLTQDGTRLLVRASEILALNDAIWTDLQGGSPPPDAADDLALPLRAQRETFTNQLMLTLLTNEKFTEAYAMIMRAVEDGVVIDPQTVSHEDDAHYMALLSMLEYIAIHFLSNTVDRETIMRQRRSGLLRVHERLADYIEYKRQAWNRPNAYRSFEAMVRQYLAHEHDAA